MLSTDALPETIGSIPTVPTWKPAPESLWVRLDCFADFPRNSGRIVAGVAAQSAV
jgi:hypothetical protein